MYMKSFNLNLIQSQQGLGLLEILIALSILFMTFFTLHISLAMIQGQKMRTDIFSKGLFLETHILSSLGEYSIYEGYYNFAEGITFRDRLAEGLQPSGLTVGLGEVPVATVGAERRLNFDYRPCSAQDSNCHFRVELDMQCPDGTDSPCFAAYRIQFENMPAQMVSLRPLGAPSSSPGFAPSDYTYPIHFERILRVKEVSCPPDTPILMGFDRESGEAFCIKTPERPDCPEGTLFAGYEVQNGDFIGVCNPTRSVTCPNPYSPLPNPYALEQVWAGSHQGIVGFFDGQCIFATEPEGPWRLERSSATLFDEPLSQSFYVDFNACPAPYYASDVKPTDCALVDPPLTDVTLSLSLIPKDQMTNETYRCHVYQPDPPPPEWENLDNFVIELVLPSEAKCVWDPDMNIQQRIPAIDGVVYAE